MGQVIRMGPGGQDQKPAGVGQLSPRTVAMSGGAAGVLVLGGVLYALFGAGHGPGDPAPAAAVPQPAAAAPAAPLASYGVTAVMDGTAQGSEPAASEPAPIAPGHPEWDSRHGSDLPGR